MRVAITHILILLVSGFWASLQAQTTAVMQVRVEIVSGAGLSSIEEGLIDLSSVDANNNNVKAGGFSLQTSPGTDVSISIVENAGIKNYDGEAIEFESLQVDKRTMETGEHHISLNGKIKDLSSLKGHYQGDVTAVIEYL
ncbi:hypothetical protein [Gracilimonas sediminicola]|uniref:DUF4402 domain-containing protein n=1 Tax=Gracilimonas sediminicola TaxID=2952158 RepID=A0A9X2L2F8_9BACT|nr:hypothetical protein [Gracilimonas sediminicola]MCP9291075.1 hypothetical protein [Gracilimonas sediminicola]